METAGTQAQGPAGCRIKLRGAIFDVDGVLVASPHERAWREALAGFADPARFTTEFYQAHVAGKPRLDAWRSSELGIRVADKARQPRQADPLANRGDLRLSVRGPERNLGGADLSLAGPVRDAVIVDDDRPDG